MPLPISSFVTPAVSAAVIVSTTSQPPIGTSRSSKRTTPSARRCTRTHGTVCFCPLSAIAHHHASPSMRARSHARISGLSPLLSER